MTQQSNLKYINKALQMELLKSQIIISLTKLELQSLIAEALADANSAAAIKRVLNPLLEGKFPQFPTFTNIVIGETTEDGSTLVMLKEPRQATVNTKAESPLKSMEPLELTEPEAPIDDTPDVESESPAYVG